MSTIIKLKRSETGSSVPAPGDLQTGEVALNTADKKIYAKDSGSNIVAVANGIELLPELTDVTNTGTVGQVLKKITSTTYAFDDNSALEDLSVTTNAAGSPSLTFDGTSVLTYTPPEFEGLGDVDVSTSATNANQRMVSDGDGTYSFQDDTFGNLLDVDIPSPASGNFIAWNPAARAGQGAWAATVNPAELISVSVASPGAPNLSYSTSTKILSYTPPDFEGLSDVDTATSTSTANMRMVSDGDGTYSFKNDTIGNLNDVTVTTLAADNILRYDGSVWRNVVIEFLSDLTITTVSAGAPSLAFDGTSVLTYTPPNLAGLDDTNFTSLTSGQHLQWNGTDWINVANPVSGITVTTASPGTPALTFNGTSTFTYTPPIFASLSDIDFTSSLSTGNMKLKSDGDGTFSFVTDSLNSLSDVAIAGAVSGQALITNGTNWQNQTIVQLSDLTVTTAAAGIPALTFDGTNALTFTPPNFAGLDDTNFTSLASGQHLEWNGTDWVNIKITPNVTNNVDNGQVLKYDSGTSAWTSEDLYSATSNRIQRTVSGSDVIYTFL